MTVLAVIPSRFHSSRLPGKPLIPLGGAPLVQWVARRVRAAGVADDVVVATDDERVARAARAVGVEAVVSGEPFSCGTERVAAAAWARAAELVLNVQGDEPLVSAAMLRGALAALERGAIGTVATVAPAATLVDPSVVKVVRDDAGRARDFFRRGDAPEGLAHLGVYAFRRAALRDFVGLPGGGRAEREQLEQLRALDAGWPIGVELVEAPVAAINEPKDVRVVEAAASGSPAGGAAGAGKTTATTEQM